MPQWAYSATLEGRPTSPGERPLPGLGPSIGDICAATGWSLLSNFARFYNLDIPALQVWIMSA